MRRVLATEVHRWLISDCNGAQGGRGEGGELAGSGAGRGGGAGAQAGRRNARRAGGAGGRAIATMRTRGAEKYTPFPSE